MIDRRTLLTGLGAIIAAPAIVRASSLMPVKSWRDEMADWRAHVANELGFIEGDPIFISADGKFVIGPGTPRFWALGYEDGRVEFRTT